MTRMRSKLSPCTFLLPLGVLVGLATGELEYYRDVIPESPEDITLKQLARYLGAQAHQQHGFYHTRLPAHLKPRTHKERFLELARQKERNILETLPEKPSIIDVLQKEKLKQFNYQQQTAQSDLLNEFTGRNEQDHSYFDLDPMPDRYEEYVNFGVPLLNNKLNSENVNFENVERSYPIESAFMNQEEEDIGRGMKEVPFSEFQGKQMQLDKERQMQNENHLTEFNEPEVEFTFKFDKLKPEKDPFAVKPNDPRYYRDAAFSIITNDTPSHEEPTKRIEEEDEEVASNNKEQVSKQMFEVQKFPNGKFESADDGTLPEPQRRAEHDPLILPVNHKINNDIYFIAIVAGCSAAAMFALVLISLTWCRLQRGVKAAADIEYPAYGVTGPNKDISPSGDQRLAQSAQMYHFQHQKQQIIAMENRTAAARDPGSVSEAESDEENEEGDYTVYECPGLAPTGEMEVKNPLFHDDPTPATPAQANQQGDQM